jgi:hypothetical protein
MLYSQALKRAIHSEITRFLVKFNYLNFSANGHISIDTIF